MEKNGSSQLPSAVKLTRKLAAILSADVQGYSRLMGDNEVATITTLTAYRETMTTLIQQHHGRVVDSPGDNLLAEFASAVEAVQAAVAIQHALRTRNSELPAQRQMHYRIGLNVGDVMEEGQRLYGDGVNIAARIESLAEGGGISISGTVYDQVKNKLSLHYEEQGTQQVKNIAEPVRVYRIRVEESSSLKSSSPESKVAKAKPHRVRSAHRAIVAGLLLLAAAVVAVRYAPVPLLVTRHSSLVTEEAQPPSLSLPDKPSIVVLPFTNMSGDPEQEYFSDGVTDTLKADLSKLSGLFVIARSSTFFYEGKPIKIEQIGRELGVRYVLKGSVQRAGERVRITIQLIDAPTGRYVWAERYDRELKDIFLLQDEVTQEVVVALRVAVQEAERERVSRIPTDNLNAYDSLLRGLKYFSHYTPEANAQARQMFERALEQDPEYADAYALLGVSHLVDFLWQWSEDPAKSLKQAFALAQRAVGLDDSLSISHRTLGLIYVSQKMHEQAIAEAERVIALSPNSADGYLNLGGVLSWAGRAEEGIGLIEKAMRLNPRYPPVYLQNLNFAYRLAGRYEEAIVPAKKLLVLNPNFLPAHLQLASCYAHLGRLEEARAEAAEVMRLAPNFSLEAVKQDLPLKDPAVLERELDAWRKAGLK